MTGDLEAEGEKELLDYLNDLNTKKEMEKEEKMISNLTVLKAAHHGSSYSTPTELLELLSPYYTVISCGKNNSYGHPHRELLKRLSDCGTDVMITYETGAVTFKTDGRNLWLSIFLQEQR